MTDEQYTQLFASVEVIKEKVSDLPELRQRVNELEHAKTKAYAIAGVVSTVGSGLVWLAKHLLESNALQTLLLVVSSWLASGCQAQPLPDARWYEADRPVELVVSTQMSTTCAISLYESANYFHDQGVDYLRIKHVDVFGPLGLRQVQIEEVKPFAVQDNSEILGVTYPLFVEHRMLAGAIQLASCDPLVVAHELGHALGLEHVEVFGNLMYPDLIGVDWSLEPGQKEWIE